MSIKHNFREYKQGVEVPCLTKRARTPPSVFQSGHVQCNTVSLAKLPPLPLPPSPLETLVPPPPSPPAPSPPASQSETGSRVAYRTSKKENSTKNFQAGTSKTAKRVAAATATTKKSATARGAKSSSAKPASKSKGTTADRLRKEAAKAVALQPPPPAPKPDPAAAEAERLRQEQEEEEAWERQEQQRRAEAEARALSLRMARQAEEEAEKAHEVARLQFWEDQRAAPSGVWTVPMGRAPALAPTTNSKATGLQEALAQCAQDGRTPLLLDDADSKPVDSFYCYQHCQILEAKAMFLDVARGERSHSQVMEDARRQLVQAMKWGQVLYIRLANSAADFRGKYTGDTTLPLAVFDARQVRIAAGCNNLLDLPDHPFTKCLRDSDLEHHGIWFGVKPGFDVIVSSHFAPEDAFEFLADSLPMHKLQPIHVTTN